MYPPLSKSTIVLHWLIAVGIIGMLALGWIMADMPKGPDKSALVDLHKSIGIVVGLLALARVALRLREGWPKPVAPFPMWEQRSAHWIHGLLLLLTIAMPLTGILKSVTFGRPVSAFGVQLLPADLMAKNDGLHEIVSVAHSGIAYLLAGLISFHVLAALKHHILDRDATFLRMAGMNPGQRNRAS